MLRNIINIIIVIIIRSLCILNIFLSHAYIILKIVKNIWQKLLTVFVSNNKLQRPLQIVKLYDLLYISRVR